jgi:hypothetical protein
MGVVCSADPSDKSIFALVRVVDIRAIEATFRRVWGLLTHA